MPSEAFWDVARREARRPRYLALMAMGPIAGVAIAGLQSIGLVAASPIWLIPLILVTGQVVTNLTDFGWVTWRTRPWAHAKIASQALVVTATIYTTGWGPALSVGLLLVGQESLTTVGPDALRVVLGWNLTCLLGGEVLLALGLVPSLLPSPAVHGLAILMAVGIVFSYRSLTGALAEKEQASALVESRERRFRALVLSSHELVYIVDQTGAVTYASPSCLEILGYEPDRLLGHAPSNLVHEDDIEAMREAILCAGEDGASSPEFWVRVLHRDGTWRSFEGIARNLTADPAVRGVVINVRDVTERRNRMEQQAAVAKLDRYALQTTSVVALSDAATDSIKRLTEARSCRIVSRDAPDGNAGTVEMMPPWSRVLPGNATDAGPSKVRVVIGDPAQPMGHIELDPTHPLTDDERRFVESIASILLSAMVRSRAEDAMRHQAMHDPLTGLPNRTLFNDRLEHALHRRGRLGGYVAVLIVDLDGFKNVNDSLGHQAGDALLNGVADRLRTCLRDIDTIARLGGDEFAILVDDLEAMNEVHVVAQRVLDALVVPIQLGDRNVAIGASVGFAITQDIAVDPDRLLGEADAAMYRAKREGKGCYREFEESMHAAADERMDLEQTLRRAIVEGHLSVHYQPILDARLGTVVSFEALSRLSHPTRGSIPPTRFIALAEELGLIVDIGRFVLFEACRQARIWNETFGDQHLGIAVNVSVRQIVDPSFVGDVAEALATSGIAPSSLTIEITESVLANDPGRVVRVLNEIRQTGVRVAIDDFGTGYSSFATLAELPIDILKIDKRFVDTLLRDREGRGIVGAIIQLAQTLGLETVAEGVELADQHECLAQMGCTHIQGFLHGHPMASGAVLDYLHGRIEAARPGERVVSA